VSKIVILCFKINNFVNIMKNEAIFIQTYENIKWKIPKFLRLIFVLTITLAHEYGSIVIE